MERKPTRRDRKDDGSEKTIQDFACNLKNSESIKIRRNGNDCTLVYTIFLSPDVEFMCEVEGVKLCSFLWFFDKILVGRISVMEVVPLFWYRINYSTLPFVFHP